MVACAPEHHPESILRTAKPTGMTYCLHACMVLTGLKMQLLGSLPLMMHNGAAIPSI